MLLRPSESGIPEVTPSRLDPFDRAGIRAHLDEHGFACVRGCMSQAELDRAEDLLWMHLEGVEAASQRMAQKRPVGWRRGQPTTWREGHADGLMTSTTHCDSMWYVRSRPGVINAFHAAYGTHADSELVAAFDRMSVNLPVSSGNPAALRVAAATSQNGKFGVAQGMHVHLGQFYGPDFKGPEYYAIVPLFDMNRKTGATALVPGSHRKVQEIEERWHQKWGRAGAQASSREKLLAAADLEPFESCGLTPCVTNIEAGDCVLFDTALFHGAYAAEDPTGKSGNGENELLRAIYILGMAFSRLQTPHMLEARRKAYEMDLFWPPTIAHAAFAEHILAGKLDGQYDPSLARGTGSGGKAAQGTLEQALLMNLEGRPDTGGEVFPRIREFAHAEPEVQRLIDPTYARATKL